MPPTTTVTTTSHSQTTEPILHLPARWALYMDGKIVCVFHDEALFLRAKAMSGWPMGSVFKEIPPSRTSK